MKTKILLISLMLLTACTSSENPLLGENNEPDLYLLGTWYYAGIDDNGTLVIGDTEEYFTVSLKGGDLWITSIEGAKSTVFEAVTTRIGATRYLSMRPVEWTGFEDGQPSDKETIDSCPWQILKYQTYMPNPLPDFESVPGIEADFDSSDVSHAEMIRQSNSGHRGNLVFVDLMKTSTVDDFIEAEAIAGYKSDSSSDICITSPTENIRELLQTQSDSIFVGEDWFTMIRATD